MRVNDRKWSAWMLMGLLTLTTSGLAGCASYDKGGAEASALPNGDYAQPDASDAQARLYAHDIAGAQAEYQLLKDTSARAGRPAAGVAITSLLLLPYSPSATRILTSHLQARDALNRQGDVLWGDQGLAYFVARGVAWDDTPATAGIKTLLVDRLPWSRQQLDTVAGFVSGLNKPVALLAADLPALAGELSRIATDLGIATADEGFTTFFLPGQVFHDESLDLTLGKSELSLVRGVVLGAEAALHIVAAYEHAWTLERAFSDTVWASIISDDTDPEHVDGAEAIDYQIAHVNESLGRAIASADELDKASTAAAGALRSLASAVEFGVESDTQTTLDWRGADPVVASQLAEFLNALADAVAGPTELPFTEPAQTADLSVIFAGRTVAAEDDLLYVDRYDDGIEIVSEVLVDQAVLDTVIEGAFEPPFDAEPAPQLTIEDDVSRLIDAVSSDLSNDFERSVSGSF